MEHFQQALRSRPKLTKKQLAFVKAFMGECKGHPGKAAKKAGFECSSDRNFATFGAKLLRKPSIIQAIKLYTDRDPLALKVEQIQREIMSCAVGEWPDAKAADRLRALELLAKMQGMFIKKVEHTGPEGGPIKVLTCSISVPQKVVDAKSVQISKAPTELKPHKLGSGREQGAENPEPLDKESLMAPDLK